MIDRGIRFGDIHSFYDLDLILSKVEIAPAKPKTTYIDIPGADGSLDLTEAHGDVKYSDRAHKFTFSMNPSSDLSETAWMDKMTEVSNALNGMSFNITLDKDPDYYWEGRCTVDEYASNKKHRQIVVSAIVRPYKLRHEETVVSVTVTPNEKQLGLRINNSRKSVCPTIEFSSTHAKVIFYPDGKPEGDRVVFIPSDVSPQKNLDICFKQGENMVIVEHIKNVLEETCNVTFRFREGDL